MAQYIDKAALVAEIYALLDDKFQCNSYDETTGFQNALILIKKFLDTLEVKEVQEEPVSEDLEDATQTITYDGKVYTRCYKDKLDAFSCKYPMSVPKPSKRYAKYSDVDLTIAVKEGAQWKEKNILKPADGEDLPEINREVIALLDNGKVVFAHRPPEYWDGRDIVTGEITRNYVERYDKGQWNQPNVKWWLDIDLSKSMQNKK